MGPGDEFGGAGRAWTMEYMRSSCCMAVRTDRRGRSLRMRTRTASARCTGHAVARVCRGRGRAWEGKCAHAPLGQIVALEAEDGEHNKRGG